MCEFISWIEKGEKVYYLTGKQIFETEKGREFREWCKSVDDYPGHGAIRWFYGLEQHEGVDKECTNFTSPDNFPKAIVKALKNGEYRGFPLPKGLLSKPLKDKYWADWKQLEDKYEADRKPLDDKYEADWKQLEDKYWADWKQFYDKYEADWKQFYDKYEADRKQLEDKYWDLFTIKENRAEAWR